MKQIICENADLGYPGVTVVHGLNFAVNSGDYLCIIGENGAGKSTLLKTILGLKQPIAGKISFDDSLSRNTIGYLPQQTEIQRDFPASVREIVRSGCLNRMGLRPFYRAEEKQRCEEIMNRLGVGTVASKSYRELSGGQQQKVLLARALCATANLLVLDEPAAGLDVKATREMYEMIDVLNREDGITVIMVTHDIDIALKHATHILHLAHIPLFFGTTEEYLTTDFAKSFLRHKALSL